MRNKMRGTKSADLDFNSTRVAGNNIPPVTRRAVFH